MTAAFPTERWFWFDPPFHAGQSALLHKQPDDIWRIDLQLGRDADADAEREPARVSERVARMIGHERVRAGVGLGLPLPVPAHGDASCMAG